MLISSGLFWRSTILKVSKGDSKVLEEEIFGPTVAVYVYEDAIFSEDLYRIIDEASKFALSDPVAEWLTAWADL